MKFKRLFFIVFCVFFFYKGTAKNDTIKINKKRFFIVGGALGSTLAASYCYVQNAWWSEKKVSFHFDDGPDLIYALNVDKAGHFLGGLQSSDVFASSIEWAGVERKKALWYGAAVGSGLQLAIELKDAYAPYWGFSKWDLAIGAAGSFWPIAKYYNTNLERIDFKFSYYRHSNVYWDLERQRGKEISKYSWQDDYPNQTYWVSFDIKDFIEASFWPDWLNVAVGFGLDDSQYLNESDAKTGGKNEWYISLDYNLPKMFKRWDNPTAKKIKYWLNYFHLPSPAIRISPRVEFYPLFL